MTLTNRPRYDWDKIRTEYIQGYFVPDPTRQGGRYHKYPTLQELCDKYGCSFQTIKARSSTEYWTKRKEAFAARISDKVLQNQISTFLSESAQFDAMTLDKLHKMHKLLDVYFKKYDHYYDEDALDFVLTEEDEVPSLTELKQATEILDRCQSLVRRTVGEPVASDHQLYNNLHKIFTETSSIQYDKNGKVMAIDGDSQEALDTLHERKQVRDQMTEELKNQLKELKEQARSMKFSDD